MDGGKCGLRPLQQGQERLLRADIHTAPCSDLFLTTTTTFFVVSSVPPSPLVILCAPPLLFFPSPFPASPPWLLGCSLCCHHPPNNKRTYSFPTTPFLASAHSTACQSIHSFTPSLEGKGWRNCPHNVSAAAGAEPRGWVEQKGAQDGRHTITGGEGVGEGGSSEDMIWESRKRAVSHISHMGQGERQSA